MEGDEHTARAATNAAAHLQAQPVDQPAGDGMGPRKKKDKHVYKGRRQMDDSFMMYLYKVKLCTRQTTHNWKLCPWAHPGETAALRRHPNCHSAELCPAVRMNQECPHGETCTYSRNAFECWLHPDRYRTTMCSMGEACNRNICFFAHNAGELRHQPSTGSAAPPASDAESDQRLRVQLQHNIQQQQQQQQMVVDTGNPVSPRILNIAAAAAGIVAGQEAAGAAAVPARRVVVPSARAGMPALMPAASRASSNGSSSAAAAAAAAQLAYPSVADAGGYAVAGEYGYIDDRSPGLSGTGGSTSSTPIAASVLASTAPPNFREMPQTARVVQLSTLQNQHQLQLAEQRKEHERQMLALQMMVLKRQQDNAVMHLMQVQDRETAALVQQLQSVTVDDGAVSPHWLQQQRQQLAAAMRAGMGQQQQQQLEGHMHYEVCSSGIPEDPVLPARLVLNAQPVHLQGVQGAQATAVHNMHQVSSPPQFQQLAGQQFSGQQVAVQQQQQQLASIVQMQQLAAAAQQQQRQTIGPQVAPLGQQLFLGSPRVQQHVYNQQQQRALQPSPMLQQLQMPTANSLHTPPDALAVRAAELLPPDEPQQQQQLPLQLLNLLPQPPGQHGLWR